MDEGLPTLHLELLEMCQEIVEQVMFLSWNQATALKIRVFPAPAPILFCLIAFDHP